MNKTALLTATAIIALTGGAAWGAALHPNAGTNGARPHMQNTVFTVAWPGHAPGGGYLWYNQIDPNNGDVACPKGGVSAYVSDNFTSGHYGNSFDSALADDFVYSGGARWSGVTEVDVCGTHAGWPGPANSINITFYKDVKASKKNPFSHPGACIMPKIKGQVGCTITLPVVAQSVPTAGTCAPSSTYSTSGGKRVAAGYAHYACYLPFTVKKGVTHPVIKVALNKTYWVSAVANLQFITSSSGALKNGEWYWDIQRPYQHDEATFQNPGGGFGTGCTTWMRAGDCFGVSSFDLYFALWG